MHEVPEKRGGCEWSISRWDQPDWPFWCSDQSELLVLGDDLGENNKIGLCEGQLKGIV